METRTAIYPSPLAQETDDFAYVYRRGETVPLKVHDGRVRSPELCGATLYND